MFKGVTSLLVTGQEENHLAWVTSHHRLLPLHVESLLSFFCCPVAKLCLTLWDPTDCSTPGFSVLHYLLEFTQTHVHRVGDAIQPSHPLSSPSPPVFNLSQHQGLFKWVSSLHQVAEVLELQLHFLEVSFNYPPCCKLLTGNSTPFTVMLCLKQPWPYCPHA